MGRKVISLQVALFPLHTRFAKLIETAHVCKPCYTPMNNSIHTYLKLAKTGICDGWSIPLFLWNRTE
jgi:hypothetical protein